MELKNPPVDMDSVKKQWTEKYLKATKRVDTRIHPDIHNRWERFVEENEYTRGEALDVLLKNSGY